MEEMTAEQFAQRCMDVGLLDALQLEHVWSELGRRDGSVKDFCSHLLRKELLTNFQIERMLAGKRSGYFYGPYKVLYIIGAGSFARVYRAVHRDSGEVMAVKVLRQRYSEDLGRTEQFLREAKMVMDLRHPNIVPIHDVHSGGGTHYMVMSFVEGQNLRDFVKVRKKLNVDEALRVMSDVTAGLDYAFKRGITHRDMKLSNVLISSRGRAQLADFGLAAAAEAAKSDEALADTPNPRSVDYAALERASNVRRDDKRSDLYFAGCMLYQMLSGHSPLHETRDRMQRLNPQRFLDVRPLVSVAPELPARAVMLVNKAMELNADKRFQSPGEMNAEIKAALEALKAGDAAPVAAGTPGKAAAETPAKPRQAGEQEGKSFTVMVIECAAEIQDVLRDRLKKVGYRVLVIGDPRRAIDRIESEMGIADCVVFSTWELGLAAVEAFNHLGENEFTRDVPAVLLVDKRQKMLIERAQLDDHRVIVPMPLKFKQLRAKLKELIAARKAKTKK